MTTVKDDKQSLEYSDVPENTIEPQEDFGEVQVADEVISIVAGLAAIEVEGVAGMSGGIRGGISELLGKKNFSKGIKVDVHDSKSVSIVVYVIVNYGVVIPDVALKIQENIKNSIENMTGYVVDNIDIHVQGVVKNKKNEIETV